MESSSGSDGDGRKGEGRRRRNQFLSRSFSHQHTPGMLHASFSAAATTAATFSCHKRQAQRKQERERQSPCISSVSSGPALASRGPNSRGHSSSVSDCVCVTERSKERGRKSESRDGRQQSSRRTGRAAVYNRSQQTDLRRHMRVFVCGCGCVCVCVQERVSIERDRSIQIPQ